MSEFAGKSFPMYQDLWISVASAFGIQVLKFVIKWLFRPCVDAIRRPKKVESDVMKKINSENAVVHIDGTIVNLILTLHGYYAMNGKEWVPWYLGGANNMEKLSHDYPFTELHPEVYTFMLVALG